MFLVLSCSCICPIQWSQVISREWRCSWRAPTGAAPTTSEWSTVLLSVKVRLILEVWRYWYGIEKLAALLALCKGSPDFQLYRDLMFLCCWSEQAAEQMVELPAIWDTMMLITLMICIQKLKYPDGFIFHNHDDAIKWKNFPRYWPFVRGIHRSPVNSPHKGQWRGALKFSLCDLCLNREASHLRSYLAHYDVFVMMMVSETLNALRTICGGFHSQRASNANAWCFLFS